MERCSRFHLGIVWNQRIGFLVDIRAALEQVFKRWDVVFLDTVSGFAAGRLFFIGEVPLSFAVSN